MDTRRTESVGSEQMSEAAQRTLFCLEMAMDGRARIRFELQRNGIDKLGLA